MSIRRKSGRRVGALALLILGCAAAAAGAPDESLPEKEKRLSAIESKGFETWFALGDVLREEEKPREAEDALKRALALRPDEPRAEDALARVYEETGRYEEEAALVKSLIGRNPEDHFLYSRLAGADVRLGRLAEAKQAFTEAKKRGRGAADAYINEGYFLLDSGELVHSKEDFESAIAVDTSNPMGYHHMGAYMARSGLYPEAEKYFRRALTRLQEDPHGRIDDLLHTAQWLGEVLEAQGRPADAEAVYLKGLENAPPGNDHQLHMLWSLAKIYASQEKIALAEETEKRALAACRARFGGPSSQGVDALIELGQFYLGQGRRAAAEEMAEQADKTAAGVPIGQGLSFEVLRRLSFFYASLNDTNKREALYRRLLPLRRTMPFNHDLVWVETGLADLESNQKRFGEAEEHDRQAIGILERDAYWKEAAGVLEALAQIYEMEGRPRPAAEARERAKSLKAD